jgi:hypothetical protein
MKPKRLLVACLVASMPHFGCTKWTEEQVRYLKISLKP